jgi:hypothetical protein
MLACRNVFAVGAAFAVLVVAADQVDIMDETALLQVKLHQNKRAVTISPAASNKQAPTEPLYNWYNPSRTDNQATIGTWAAGQGYQLGTGANGSASGYIGEVFSTQQPGTVAIYNWWSSSREDNFATIGDWAAGSGYVAGGGANDQGSGLIGYIYPTAQPGTAPLYNWWNGNNVDNFATIGDWPEDDGYSLGGGANGQSSGLIGYILTTTTTTTTLSPKSCKATNGRVGNMSYIGGVNFTGEQPWPKVPSSKAYQTISLCTTAPVCDTANLTNSIYAIPDLRSAYQKYSGSSEIDVWIEKLSNGGLMESVYKNTPNVTKKDFDATVTMLLNEVGLIKGLDGWYTTYASVYIDINSQMDEAFSTMLTLLDMPASSQVAKKGHSWLSICLDTIVAVASVIAIVGTGGAAAAGVCAAVGASMAAGATVVGDAVACAEDCSSKGTGGLSTPAPGEADNMASSMEYSKMIALLMMYLDQILEVIVGQRNIIAGNWGRLKTAAELVTACPLDPVQLKTVVLSAYGAMQWIALGVLMPNKYAIYWQRDYSGSKGPSCYYNGADDGKGDAYGCEGSDMGCWSPPGGSWSMDSSAYYNCGGSGRDKSEGGKSSCFQDVGSSDASGGGQSCSQTTRYIWVGEVGAPSSTPPSDFFESLTSAETGPIATFVNKRFGTTYSGASGGFQAFVSQCQYMPKLYIPPSSNNNLDQSTSSESVVGQPCNIYDLTLTTYAFPDCNTNLDLPGQGAGLTGTCVNGYGSSFGASDSMWGSGNFNQFIYIPNKKNHYASNNDGQVGCCSPWLSGLQSGCDYMLCDCWSLAQGGNNNWLNEGSDGQSSNSGSWWGSCEVDTNEKNTEQMMTTSEGPACNWTTVTESENDYSACR